MKDLDDRLAVSWWALRIGLGVGPIITGADKFFNKLTDWGISESLGDKDRASQHKHVYARRWRG
jgi:hypothetical protein